MCCFLATAGVAVLAFFIAKLLWRLLPSKAEFDASSYKRNWFGKGAGPEDESSNDGSVDDVRSFKIEVPEIVLSDLMSRLENTRLEDPVDESKFLYGFNPNYLREILDYWRNKYDWREQEAHLNKYPHFKTNIEGIDVHFMHIKPEMKVERDLKVIPLMLIHGWPGSFVEFYKIIPLLTTFKGRDFVFEVVVPSIPGFGFSESPHRKGFTSRAAARVFMTLMERLNHHKFYVQGGDWGSHVATNMARHYPGRILGLHLNMLMSNPGPWEAVKYFIYAIFPFGISKEEYKFVYPVRQKATLFYEETAYFHMQSTKPDTLGCGISDSPAGMAAYLLEKFSVATNTSYVKLPDGGLTQKFTLNELLTNVMVYWVNNNFTAAARFYKENVLDRNFFSNEKIPVVVATAIAAFPNEVLMRPRKLLPSNLQNLISYNLMPRGGHFAALEEPELLADDVWQFVETVEKKSR